MRTTIVCLGLLSAAVTGCGGSADSGETTRNVPSAPPDKVVTVPVQGNPGLAAAGLGRVWVAGHRNGYVYEIDPRTARVSHTVPVGGTFLIGLSVTEDAVWVVRDDTHSLVKIDPRSRRVVARRPLGEAVNTLTPLNEALWGIAPESGSLVRIDPATMKIAARVRLPKPMLSGAGLALTEADDMLWVGGFGRIVEINPDDGSIVRRLRIAGEASSLAVGSRGIYFVNPNATDLLRIDRDGGRAKRVARTSSQPGILRLVGRNLMLTDDGDPAVTRFDAASGRRRASVVLRRGPVANNTMGDSIGVSALVSAAGALWLPDWSANKVYRVPLTRLTK